MLRRRVRTLATTVVRRFGYDLVASPAVVGKADYGLVRPGATYSPWKVDIAFQNAYRTAAAYTLVEEVRCWELWTLVRETAKLPAGALLEVGVWRGGTGALIAKQARAQAISDPIYLCDTFSGVVKAGEHDDLYRGGEHSDASADHVRTVLSRLGVDDVHILSGVFPDDTGSSADASSFRFIHVDVDVYDSARDVLNWAWPRLVVGGVVVYDDYGFDGCAGIVRHVEEQHGEADRLVLHNLNGHAILVKLR